MNPERVVARGGTDQNATANLATSRRGVLLAAAPPLISQLGFSIVSFCSIAGLARNSNTLTVAAVFAAYSLESIALSWCNARWASLLVFREALSPRRGDVALMARAFALTTLVGLPVFFVAAFMVAQSVTIAVWAAIWSASMLLGDTFRYACSRFLGARPITMIASLHVLAAVGYSFFGHQTPAIYLAVLSAINLAAALAYCLALRARRDPGTSTAWVTHRGFGVSMATETAMTSSAAGLGGAVVAWINPILAVGLQLGNQILAMPASVLVQSVGLPLSRQLRARMDTGSYPRKLLASWAAIGLAVPVLGLIALWVCKPAMYLLLGSSGPAAYYFLPVVFLQVAMILPWQPLTMARRWTHGPDNARHHVVVTVAVFYLSLLVVAATVDTASTIRAALVIVGCALMGSTFTRGLLWFRAGWTRPSGSDDDPMTDSHSAADTSRRSSSALGWSGRRSADLGRGESIRDMRRAGSESGANGMSDEPDPGR